MSDDLVPVAAYGSPTEAHQARQILETAGIRATVVGEHAIGVNETFGAPGIELRVSENDAEQALQILEGIESRRPERDRDERKSELALRRDDLVTLATYDSPIEAQLALGVLQDSGIKAVLADAELIAMDWLLSNAVGGIKLQVLRSDLLAAERVLMSRDIKAEAEAETLRPRLPPPPQAITEVPTTAVTAEPPLNVLAGDTDALNETEETLVRASRGALFGLLLMPLQIYVFFLLLQVATSPEPIRPSYRWRVVFSWCLCLPCLVLLWILMRFFLGM